MTKRKTPLHNAVVRKRARKVQAMLAKHYDADDIETSVMDCLADIMHLCAVKDSTFQYDFGELCRRAMNHEQAERLGIE